MERKGSQSWLIVKLENSISRLWPPACTDGLQIWMLCSMIFIRKIYSTLPEPLSGELPKPSLWTGCCNDRSPQASPPHRPTQVLAKYNLKSGWLLKIQIGWCLIISPCCHPKVSVLLPGHTYSTLTSLRRTDFATHEAFRKKSLNNKEKASIVSNKFQNNQIFEQKKQ